MPSTGVTIPSGTFISISSALAQRREDCFEEPLAFDPWRFSPERKDKNTSALFAFGSGAHPCAGRKFAIYEMALFEAEILQKFDLQLEDLPPVDDFTASVMGGGTVDPNHPPLDPSQVAFLWRPCVPVMVQYKRKEIAK